MKLHRLLFLLSVVAASVFAGCSDGADVYIGTWHRIPAGDSLYRGFTLGGNGIAAPLNESTNQYNSWRRKRDTLWLSGQRFTDTSVAPFIDTLIVKKITSDSLVVRSEGRLLHFSRE